MVAAHGAVCPSHREMAPEYEKSRTLVLSLLFLATVAPLVLRKLLARISPAPTSIQSVTSADDLPGRQRSRRDKLFLLYRRYS